jgi:hypothetical protein
MFTPQDRAESSKFWHAWGLSANWPGIRTDSLRLCGGSFGTSRREFRNRKG